MIMRRLFDTPAKGTNLLEELEQMRQRISRFYEEPGKTPRRAGVFPLINVTENKESYFIRAELPGMKADEIDISATADSLALSGERKIPDEDKNVNYHRRERESGKFSRMFSLPSPIDASKAEAKMTDGILTVILPKAESAKPRQIAIR